MVGQAWGSSFLEERRKKGREQGGRKEGKKEVKMEGRWITPTKPKSPANNNGTL